MLEGIFLAIVVVLLFYFVDRDALFDWNSASQWIAFVFLVLFPVLYCLVKASKRE